MARMNWNKAKKHKGYQSVDGDNKVKPSEAAKRRQQFKLNYSETYKDKEFWIGGKKIPRYHPDRGHKVECGLVFNARAGRFEAWKDSKRLGDMGWKVGQAALKEWAAKFGWSA